MRNAKRLCLSLLMVLLAGCMTPGGIFRAYQGPERDPKDVVVLDWTNSNVMVTHIDGKYVHDPNPYFTGVVNTIAHLQPGNHSITFSHSWRDLYYQNRSAELVGLRADFQPGQSYTISDAPCKTCKPFSVVFMLQDAGTEDILEQRTVTGVVSFGHVRHEDSLCSSECYNYCEPEEFACKQSESSCKLSCGSSRFNPFSHQLRQQSRWEEAREPIDLSIDQSPEVAPKADRLALVEVSDKRPLKLGRSARVAAYRVRTQDISFDPPEAEIVKQRLEFALHQIMKNAGAQTQQAFYCELEEFRVQAEENGYTWELVAQITVSLKYNGGRFELSGKSTESTFNWPANDLLSSVVDDALKQVVARLQAYRAALKPLR